MVSALSTFDIGLNHLLNELIECDLSLPSENLLSLCGSTEKKIDLSGTEVSLINSNENFASLRALSNLVDSIPLSFPNDSDTDMSESLLDEFTNGMGLSSSENEIIRFVLLKHSPHSLDVITGVSPITLGVQVTEVEALLLTERDFCDGARDLAGDESSSTSRRFVVEEDTVRGVHSVRFTVVLDDPESVKFRYTVRGTRVEGSSLGLRSFNDLSVEFGGRGLVESNVVVQSASSDSIEETECSETVDITSVFSHIERNLDVRLGSKIVNFGRLNGRDDGDKVGGIGKISVVENHLGALVNISVQVLDTTSVERGRTTNQSVNLVTFLEEKFSEVRTILTSDT